VAYDALDNNNKSLVDKGIDLAKDMQQSIVRSGTGIIDRKEVKLANDYRYVTLENDTLKDT
jgi:hypothetical protein